GVYELSLDESFPHLRFYHVKADGQDIYFFFNESPDTPCCTNVTLPLGGDFVRLRLLEDTVYDDMTCDNVAELSLLPGQSELWVFGERVGISKKPSCDTKLTLSPTVSVSLAHSEDLSHFEPYAVTDRLTNLTGAEGIRDFAGIIRYTFTFTVDEVPKAAELDLGEVGEVAHLYVNGCDLGVRVAVPYRFSLDGVLAAGENTVTVEVANTLAYKLRDHFSHYLALKPSGLLGPITLWYHKT
ncbi:MAG: hypothetical protein IJW46_07205, partial [Clostridia bacterium]|nr:hypothetical protein [Clostridia bacterium]